jgi:hypothetical protein
MSELIYLLMGLLTVAAYIVGGWLLWQAVEGAYWIYCKVKGKDY